jgi:hypothetical protein
MSSNPFTAHERGRADLRRHLAKSLNGFINGFQKVSRRLTHLATGNGETAEGYPPLRLA